MLSEVSSIILITMSIVRQNTTCLTKKMKNDDLPNDLCSISKFTLFVLKSHNVWGDSEFYGHFNDWSRSEMNNGHHYVLKNFQILLQQTCNELDGFCVLHNFCTFKA